MRTRVSLLSLSVLLAGACALGGCKNEQQPIEGDTLIIDDDRTSGATVTVFYALGVSAPLSTTVTVGGSTKLIVASGTYTVTFDDDGTAGVSAGDTVQAGVVVQSGRVTTVEYAGEDDTGVIGPNLHANG